MSCTLLERIKDKKRKGICIIEPADDWAEHCMTGRSQTSCILNFNQIFPEGTKLKKGAPLGIGCRLQASIGPVLGRPIESRRTVHFL
jgi:hypothetical protein